MIFSFMLVRVFALRFVQSLDSSGKVEMLSFHCIGVKSFRAKTRSFFKSLGGLEFSLVNYCSSGVSLGTAEHICFCWH